MWRAVIVVGIVFALLAYACIVVGARSEDNRRAAINSPAQLNVNDG